MILKKWDATGSGTPLDKYVSNCMKKYYILIILCVNKKLYYSYQVTHLHMDQKVKLLKMYEKKRTAKQIIVSSIINLVLKLYVFLNSI